MLRILAIVSILALCAPAAQAQAVFNPAAPGVPAPPLPPTPPAATPGMGPIPPVIGKDSSTDQGSARPRIELGSPARARCDLRLEVCDVLGRVPGRVSGAREQRQGLRLAEAPALDEREAVDVDAFLLDGPGIGAHGARRDTADVGVMTPARDIEENLAPGLVEDRQGKLVPITSAPRFARGAEHFATRPNKEGGR